MIHLEDDDGKPPHLLPVTKLSLCADAYMSQVLAIFGHTWLSFEMAYLSLVDD